MNTEEIDQRRLRWKCRRGMLELDLILEDFFVNKYVTLVQNEKKAFAKLLDCEDTDLLAWLLHAQQPTDPEIRTIVLKINKNPIVNCQ